MRTADVRLERIEADLARLRADLFAAIAALADRDSRHVSSEVKRQYRLGYRAGYCQGRRKAEPTWDLSPDGEMSGPAIHQRKRAVSLNVDGPCPVEGCTLPRGHALSGPDGPHYNVTTKTNFYE